MKTNQLGKLGWAAALAATAFIVFSGFQGGPEKSGVVDMNRAISESKFGLKNVASFKTVFEARNALMTFIDNTRVVRADQATKLKEYAMKATLTEAEKKDEEKIKNDITAAVKNYNNLNTKANPTDDDRRQLQEYNNQIQDTVRQLQQWQEEFTNDLQKIQGEMRKAEVQRSKDALSEVAKKAGYNVVFESQIAPYGVNDLTADVIKAMDAKP